MAAHMLDHFVFTARLLSERTKNILFGVVAFAIVANFWWFRGVAWGIDGPINEYWGLGWRHVSFGHLHCVFFQLLMFLLVLEHLRTPLSAVRQ